MTGIVNGPVTRLACVTGRFQPVHHQHLELFEIALREADHLVVAVTNPDPGARRPEATSTHRHRPSANPFTYYERVRLLAAALAERGLTPVTTIVPFDLTRPEHWAEYVPRSARQVVRAYSDWERHKAHLFADAGYPVHLLDGDPDHRLSATDIRARISQAESSQAEHHTGDADWAELVPAATVPVLRAILADHAAGERR